MTVTQYSPQYRLGSTYCNVVGATNEVSVAPDEPSLSVPLLVLSLCHRQVYRCSCCRRPGERSERRVRPVPRRLLSAQHQQLLPLRLLRRHLTERSRSTLLDDTLSGLLARRASLLRDVHHRHDRRQQPLPGPSTVVAKRRFCVSTSGLITDQ